MNFSLSVSRSKELVRFQPRSNIFNCHVRSSISFVIRMLTVSVIN